MQQPAAAGGAGHCQARATGCQEAPVCQVSPHRLLSFRLSGRTLLRLFTDSTFDSLTHSLSLFVCSRSLTHSLTHPLTHPLTHSLTHPLTHPLTHSLPSLTALSLFGVRFAQTQTYQSTATARSVSQNCTKSMLASEAAVHHTFWEQHFK